MKKDSKKIERKKYLVGTTVKNIVQNPSTVLAQNDIDVAKALYKGESNPFVQGLSALGDISMQIGMGMGGFGSISGIDANLAKGLNATVPGLTQLAKSFATGGKVPNVPVEVEGGEAGELPSGQILGFKGPSHEAGGIPIDLPEGTEIYSKRIKIDGKTMAERKIQREKTLNKYTSKANKRGDTVSSNTLKRISEILDDEEVMDRKVQESVHSMLNSEDTPRQQYGTKPTVSRNIDDSENYIPNINSEEDFLTMNSLYMFNYDPYYRANVFSKTTYPGFFDNERLSLRKVKEAYDGKENPNKNLILPSLNGELELNPAYAKSKGYIPPQERFPEDVKEIVDMSNPNLKTKNNKNSSLQELDIPLVTGGDAVNILGNIVQGVAPYLNTLKERSTDTPNVNSFKDFGEDALKKMSDSENFIKQSFDEKIKDLGLERSTNISRGRNSSRGVNTMRAMDVASTMAADKAENSIYDSYANQMLGILSKEAELENIQDKVVMEGEAQRDLADRQDKGAFYTNRGKDLQALGMTMAQSGKAMNDITERNTQLNILDSIYDNFGINPMTGKVYGKVAKDLGIPEGTILRPDFIKELYQKGKLPEGVRTLDDLYEYYGITTTDPASILSLTTTKKTTK